MSPDTSTQIVSLRSFQANATTAIDAAVAYLEQLDSDNATLRLEVQNALASTAGSDQATALQNQLAAMTAERDELQREVNAARAALNP